MDIQKAVGEQGIEKFVNKKVQENPNKDRRILKETKGAFYKELMAINDKIEDGQDVDSDVEKRFNELSHGIKFIDNLLAQEGQVRGYKDASELVYGNNPPQHVEERNQTAAAIRNLRGNDSPQGGKDVELWESVSGESKGRKVKALGKNASVSAHVSAPRSDMNWAEYMKGRIQGYTAGDTRFKAALDTTSDAALVPTSLSSEVIDQARNKARVIEAGARTVPMDSKTLTIAKLSNDGASPEWKAENASTSSTEMGFSPVTLTAKTVIAPIVKMSVEMSEDAAGVSDAIRDALAEKIALEMDRAALMGTGTNNEPTGVASTSDINSIELGTGNGAALTNYNPFSQAYQKVLENNGEPGAVIFAPRTFGEVDRFTAADNQPLRAPQSYQQLQKLVTNQVPIDLSIGTSNDGTMAFVANWSKLLLGIRTQLRIEISRVAGDSTNNAFEDLQVWIRAYARMDVAIRQPEHFTVINGITAA